MSAAVMIALSGGALSALLYLSMLSGSPAALILALLSQLPLLLIGLGQGARSALVAGVLGTALVGALADWQWMASFAFGNALPSFLLARQALLNRSYPDGRVEWYPPGLLALWMSLYAAAAFIVLLIAFSGQDGGLEASLRQQMSAEILDALQSPNLPPDAARAVDAILKVLPGYAGCSWIMTLAATMALAQAVLIRFGRNLRPTPRLADYRVPHWLIGAVAVGGALGVLATDWLGFAGLNLTFILAMPYFFGGVVCLQTVARRGRTPTPAIVILYIALVLFIMIRPWIAIPTIAGVGLIDQLAGLRQRLERPKGGSSGNQE